MDDALIRWALEKDLSARGVQVDGVENEADILDRIRGTHYGMAFLDVRLRTGGGLELLDRIHRISPETRIVALSCDATPEEKRTVYERGAWQFVEKPFDLRDVVGLVRSVFGAYNANRKHRRYLCRIPLRVSLLTPGSDSRIEFDNLSCSMVNVGPGGMRFSTGYRLRVGQRLRARVLRPGEPCACYVPPGAEAEVIWTGTTEGGHTSGVRWRIPSNPDQTS